MLIRQNLRPVSIRHPDQMGTILRDSQALVDGDGLAKAPMVSPEPAGQDAGADRIEILLRNGRVMRVGIGADATAVACLAAALEA